MAQRILYIEDDMTNRILVRKLLKNDGFEVLEAEGGLPGVELAVSELPDLILLDMSMPDIDGYETVKRIRCIDEVKDIPVVAVTANVMNGDREKVLEAGCNGYISKPIDLDTFVDTVRTFLGSEPG